VLGEIGRRPEVGDKITHDGSVFEVVAVDGLRIAQLRVWPARRDHDPDQRSNEEG
jgi:CBS domain containing-hemolysin-like protein